MTTRNGLCAAILAVLMITPAFVQGSEGKAPYQVFNRLRLEYDDNIRQVDERPSDSLKIIEQLELSLNLNRPLTFLSLRYRPSFVWWDDRSEDETDFHHAFDFILRHTFTPRVSFNLTDTFRYSDLPELIDRGTVVREENNYIYNALNASMGVDVMADTRLDISGRHVLLRYDRRAAAERNDHDIVVGGVSLRHQVLPGTSVSADARIEELVYRYTDEYDRGARTTQAGGSLEHAISRNLLANLSAGYMYKDYDDALTSSDNSPYGEIGATYLVSPKTRVSGGASYSLMETDIFPYSSQERSRFFASLAYDLTARLSWYLSATYTKGEYGADKLPQGAVYRDLPARVRRDWDWPEEAWDIPLPDEFIESIEDYAEEIYQVSTRVTYRLNRSNWLEAGWQYIHMDTDLREPYERNRIHLGWRVKIF